MGKQWDKGSKDERLRNKFIHVCMYDIELDGIERIPRPFWKREVLKP